MNIKSAFFASVLCSVVLVPPAAHACACGCNMFTVGARWTMPTTAGLSTYFQYNYMDQTRNWGEWQSLAGGANTDQEIRTSFYTFGVQYMLDRDWGITAEVPVWSRYFRSTALGENAGSVNFSSLGDARLMAMYTGIAEDMSTGVQFGVKLPTGAFNEPMLDRDTQIGTGTTDLLLGGYRMGQENGWGWYAQIMWQHAINERDGYRPGESVDVSVGVHYDGLRDMFGIAPVLQIGGSIRGHDSGGGADPGNTGYERVYISPGLQVEATSSLTLYADLRIPLLTHVSGVQLVAPALVNLTVRYGF